MIRILHNIGEGLERALFGESDKTVMLEIIDREIEEIRKQVEAQKSYGLEIARHAGHIGDRFTDRDLAAAVREMGPLQQQLRRLQNLREQVESGNIKTIQDLQRSLNIRFAGEGDDDDDQQLAA